MGDISAFAKETKVPWECSEYSGDAQTRCMNTLMELQQEKIARLEEQLKAQEGTVNNLKAKMDHQEALALREAQALKQDPRYPPPPYVSAYALPYGYASATNRHLPSASLEIPPLLWIWAKVWARVLGLTRIVF